MGLAARVLGIMRKGFVYEEGNDPKAYSTGWEVNDLKDFVYEDTCIGCGLCPEICPQVFSMNDEGLAQAIDKELDSSVIESAKEAEEECPVDAIVVE